MRLKEFKRNNDAEERTARPFILSSLAGKKKETGEQNEYKILKELPSGRLLQRIKVIMMYSGRYHYIYGGNYPSGHWST